MGRKCSVVGCHSTVGLHYFPQDLDFRRQWLRVIGLGESCELPPYAGVCKKHFARDSFASLMEFELGFAKKLLLKSEAVPTLGLPQLRKKLPWSSRITFASSL
uniref:THAP domain-containing protein 1 n=1 Tax=Neogobius melanostomus TaxID=47308 RepID=A0A8C6SI74_9GOBI